MVVWLHNAAHYGYISMMFVLFRSTCVLLWLTVAPPLYCHTWDAWNLYTYIRARKNKVRLFQVVQIKTRFFQDISIFFLFWCPIVFLINLRWRARQRALLWPSVFYSTPPGPQHWFAAYTGSAHKINHIHRCEENIDEVGHWRHCHHFLSSKRLWLPRKQTMMCHSTYFSIQHK